MIAIASTRHTEATRNAILEAAVELFIERRSDDFSIQNVADRASLTHRTVYRYYSTRQDLMDAIVQLLGSKLADVPFAGVSTVDEWMNALGAHLAVTEANLEIIRTILVASLSSDDVRLFGQGRVDRDSHLWRVFRRQFSRLDEGDARRTYASLRHLTSSTSYVLLRLRFHLSPTEATEAIRSAASAVVDRAARRDRAAQQGRTRR